MSKLISDFIYKDHNSITVTARQLGHNYYRLRYEGGKGYIYLLKRKGKWKIHNEKGNYWNISLYRGVLKDLLNNMDTWIAETILLGGDE